MRAVVQRVVRAEVRVGDELVGAIGRGILVLLATGAEDDEARAAHLAGRVATLRIHEDAAGRMNLDTLTAGGEALVVSQFTLYADTSRGHRPSFVRAGPPSAAAPLVDAFCSALRDRGLRVAEGRFGAGMAVTLTNDGPVTIVLTSGEPPWDADAG
ncbi:MAG TPA: D-aminoacyl-tRNA deacylase [Candidatus Dormibacteraeota bacterium]|nr:D-aminoacyl-tRNA deacylase [Candidatus Dormibacteraeota bacterium]